MESLKQLSSGNNMGNGDDIDESMLFEQCLNKGKKAEKRKKTPDLAPKMKKKQKSTSLIEGK